MVSSTPADQSEVSRTCLEDSSLSISTRLMVPSSYSEDLERSYTAAEEETLIRKLREL